MTKEGKPFQEGVKLLFRKPAATESLGQNPVSKHRWEAANPFRLALPKAQPIQSEPQSGKPSRKLWAQRFKLRESSAKPAKLRSG